MDFLPPDNRFNSWSGDDTGGNPPPDSNYNFFGYFYSGTNAEVCEGIWLKDDIFDPTQGIDPSQDDNINRALNEGLDAIHTSLLGIERLVNETDVPEDARREATGYLTIGEAYERGSRLPPGLEWGIYRRNGNYYLAIWGSG